MDSTVMKHSKILLLLNASDTVLLLVVLMAFHTGLNITLCTAYVTHAQLHVSFQYGPSR